MCPAEAKRNSAVVRPSVTSSHQFSPRHVSNPAASTLTLACSRPAISTDSLSGPQYSHRRRLVKGRNYNIAFANEILFHIQWEVQTRFYKQIIKPSLVEIINYIQLYTVRKHIHIPYFYLELHKCLDSGP
jgi:hypothetical protein